MLSAKYALTVHEFIDILKDIEKTLGEDALVVLELDDKCYATLGKNSFDMKQLYNNYCIIKGAYIYHENQL